MTIIRNVVEAGIGLKGEVFFPLFNDYVPFTTADHTDGVQVRKCASWLNAMPNAIRAGLCRASIRYCHDTVGENEVACMEPQDVLAMIWPTAVIFLRPESSKDLFIEIELNSEWEPEHGLEWLIRNDEILYVGPFRGLGPWVDINRKDPANFA